MLIQKIHKALLPMQEAYFPHSQLAIVLWLFRGGGGRRAN